MDVISFITIGLAAWRISSLFAAEDGPANIFAKFRSFVGVRYDELSQPVGTNIIADAFTCVWCLSVWVCVFAFISWLIVPTVTFYISIPFALSTVVIMLESYINKE